MHWRIYQRRWRAGNRDLGLDGGSSVHGRSWGVRGRGRVGGVRGEAGGDRDGSGHVCRDWFMACVSVCVCVCVCVCAEKERYS